jgi:Zn-dependent protease with chaperone function
VRGWKRHASPIHFEGIALPAFAVDESFPLVAIAGWLRPRLYVSRVVLESCTPAELAAIVAHEAGHVHSGDPWRLLFVRACPDVLGLLPAGAALASRWAEAAEEAADDHAAISQARSLDLASALIRVARLAGSRTRGDLPLTALYRGGGVATRVARILDRPGDAPIPQEHPRTAGRAVVAVVVLGTCLASLVAMEQVHRLLEAVVARLG